MSIHDVARWYLTYCALPVIAVVSLAMIGYLLRLVWQEVRDAVLRLRDHFALIFWWVFGLLTLAAAVLSHGA